jgi:hypothetical protein
MSLTLCAACVPISRAAGVRLVVECMCLLKGVAPVRVPDPSGERCRVVLGWLSRLVGTGRTVVDYWEPAKRFLLSDPRLFSWMQNFASVRGAGAAVSAHGC